MEQLFVRFAETLERDFGAYFDREEMFVECPECGEPLYSCDWDPDEYTMHMSDGHIVYRCPVCEYYLSAIEE